MGFESANVARRRLAVMASHDERIQEAIAPGHTTASEPGSNHGTTATRRREEIATEPFINEQFALSSELDVLAHEIAATPGAGGALLASYAAQVRALNLVAQAAERAPGSPLPPDVLAAVRRALGDDGHFDTGLSLLA